MKEKAQEYAIKKLMTKKGIMRGTEGEIWDELATKIMRGKKGIGRYDGTSEEQLTTDEMKEKKRT